MGKIFCLMGKSASGKDTIYTELLQRKDLGLHRVIPYTTRPRRSGETDGETYFFRTNAEADAMEAAGRVIELRAYQTMHGVWKYYTADDGQIEPENHYLLIGTLEVFEKIRNYFGVDRVCPIYVWVDDGVRLERALARERAQREPKYAEMCRRFLADEQDFSEENLQRSGIFVRFENRQLDQVMEEITSYIRREESQYVWIS